MSLAIYETIWKQAEMIESQAELIKRLSACLLQYITLEELEKIKNENDKDFLEQHSKF